MKYTQVPSTTFEQLQMNAGILVDDFTPDTGVIGNILGATTGGFTFNSNPNFSDFGEDIDNVPANTMQLKRITSYDPALSGTFLTVTPELAKLLVGSAGVSDTIHVIPLQELTESDFDDVWIIGDYSDKNTGSSAGFVAIHLMNALNTAGFQWTTTKDGKGQFAFEFHGHYDIDDVEEVPYEIYIKTGTAPSLASVTVASTDTGVTTAGDSKINISGYSLGSGEKFVYKTAASTAPSVTYGQKLTTGWDEISTGDIITPAATHTKITVAAVDSKFRAVASGNTTLTIKGS